MVSKKYVSILVTTLVTSFAMQATAGPVQIIESMLKGKTALSGVETNYHIAFINARNQAKAGENRFFSDDSILYTDASGKIHIKMSPENNGFFRDKKIDEPQFISDLKKAAKEDPESVPQAKELIDSMTVTPTQIPGATRKDTGVTMKGRNRDSSVEYIWDVGSAKPKLKFVNIESPNQSFYFSIKPNGDLAVSSRMKYLDPNKTIKGPKDGDPIYGYSEEYVEKTYKLAEGTFVENFTISRLGVARISTKNSNGAAGTIELGLNKIAQHQLQFKNQVSSTAATAVVAAPAVSSVASGAAQ